MPMIMTMCLCIAAVLIILLIIKIYLMKKSAREIKIQLAERLAADTNTLIGIPSSDKDLMELAASLNEQLKILRAEHIRYQQGDLELKTAVTNISHDLRTPLTAIISYLELLNHAPEKTEEYLPVIEERAESLSRLAEELFRYSVISSPEYDCPPETVVLNEALEESVLGFYASLSECGITPEIHITEEKIIRNVNRAALLRVFSNVLNNAVKYSDGDLNISMDDSGVIRFSNTAENLSGIQAERLFDRFYTVENARKSTGLGLSIAKILVRQMGGEISARYEENMLTIIISFLE